MYRAGAISELVIYFLLDYDLWLYIASLLFLQPDHLTCIIKKIFDHHEKYIACPPDIITIISIRMEIQNYC